MPEQGDEESAVKFQIITNDLDVTNGSSLKGRLRANYDRLVALFGEPAHGDGYKVDAEWAVRFEDDTVATIYNWKNGENFCGKGGMPVHKITDWHIGGFSDRAVLRVREVLSNDIPIKETA